MMMLLVFGIGMLVGSLSWLLVAAWLQMRRCESLKAQAAEVLADCGKKIAAT